MSDILDDLNAFIQQAWGKVKFQGQAIKCDAALARTLESIKDELIETRLKNLNLKIENLDLKSQQKQLNNKQG